MTKKYGRRTFEAIVGASNDRGLDVLHEHWLQIEDDGVYIRPPTAEERSMFSPRELAAMRPCHPAGNPDAPVLAFPFDVKALIAFEEQAQLISAMWIDLDGGRVTEQLDEEPKALIEQLLDALERSERNGTDPRKVPRQRAQENEILDVIRSLGHDPIRLPRPSPGRPGIKSEVRGIVQERREDLFGDAGIFNKAWERLRSQGAISEDGGARPSG